MLRAPAVRSHPWLPGQQALLLPAAAPACLSRPADRARQQQPRASSSVADVARAVRENHRLTGAAHDVWKHHLQPGGVAVDATCGNGYDTLWLARRVGPTGRVLGFDIQPEAISITRGLLEEELPGGERPQLDLLCACHSTLGEHVRGPVDLVCYNLGYLPSGGRGPAVTTQPESTVASLAAARAVLRPGGLISVLAYLGHEGGREECEAVLRFGAGLTPPWLVSQHSLVNHPSAPVLILLHHRETP